MTQDSDVTQLLDRDPSYTTSHGAAYQGDSRELLRELPEGSVDLIVTSPPFALQYQKEYGNEELEDYNDWFLEFAEEAYDALAPHGSFVIEIGGAFERGKPERSTYQFELLTRLTDEEETDFHLAQDFYWFNPAKLPNPIEWVNVRKIRITDAVTHVWWLSKEINKEPAFTDALKSKVALAETVTEELRDATVEIEDITAVVEAIFSATATDGSDDLYGEGVQAVIKEHLAEHVGDIEDIIEATQKAPQVFVRRVLEAVEADEAIPHPQPRPEVSNQRVLSEYSESQKNLLETGEYNEGERPSGWDIDPDSFANGNDGAIPKNLIEASNTASNTHYLEMCRKFDFDPHPARFPPAVPEFAINLLTPDPPYDDWDRGYLDEPVVLDIFAGSNVTGEVAQEHDRQWLAFEQEERYIETSQFRFLSETQIKKMMDDAQKDFGDFAEVTKD